MKKYLLSFLAIMMLCSLSFGQEKKTETARQKNVEITLKPEQVKDSLPLEVKIYTNALLFADYEVAKYAMYNLITKYPERTDYMDSLSRIYFSMGAYPQSLAAANIVLAKQPDNLQLLELTAICQNALKNSKEALSLYEKLYEKTKNIYHLYQVAVLQYSLQRYGECSGSIDKILADKEAANEKIQLSYDEQTSQAVPLNAAAYNLRGVMGKDLAQKDKAKADFEAALKIYPEFMLAKNNLEMITKPAEPQNTGKEKEKKK